MSKQRIHLEAVSLVCVETRRPQLAILAMQRCMRRIDFRECLLLAPDGCGMSSPEPIRRVPIPPIANVRDYSRFMIRHLGDHFTGSHALVVQWDGFVVHPECWDARFLEYDYIGAPWRALGNVMGNGGFSLRSRRLAQALRRLEVPQMHPEDYQICVNHRAELESRFGIRFAPTEIAERFSWEAGEMPGPTFGLHGFFNFDRAMGEQELIEYFDLCDDAMLRTIAARRLLKHLYRASMNAAAGRLKSRRMQGPVSMKLDALKLQTIARLRRLSRAG